MSNGLTIGSIVRCRDREWVLLPSGDPEVAMLRPLTGGESETCGIYLPLTNLGIDRIEPAQFPLPKPEDSGDAVSAELLWNAARLALRDGAGPFRSLGRISVRPRAYQFVPMLMALRIDPIRMLVADDVGVGKTIEALLIARELLDRGEIQRICVLCPPYLCDQWQKELQEKFQIEAVVIRSGTINKLENDIPQRERAQGVFAYYQHLVVSIDYAKADRHRYSFLLHCPKFTIVDEAHGASQPGGQMSGQQQRHELLHSLAQKENQHIVLLTATPHSGIESSFLSLLGLLKSGFEDLDLVNLSETERDTLARHFVQRRRIDVEKWMGEDTPFPERKQLEEPYDLSSKYQALFNKVFQFSRELVTTGETLSGWRRRIRYWSALALLRCVMSSPAAAQAAILQRVKGDDSTAEVDQQGDDSAYYPYIYEPTDEDTLDTQPSQIIEESESEIGRADVGHLRQFGQLAKQLEGTPDDTKLMTCKRIVENLLSEGKRPIVWCRYIATSDYVASELTRQLERRFPDLRILSITGLLADDERRAKVEELEKSPMCVLVATDCLSEGINLQAHFNAVIHYDLPWNPNRLEQREGRVDRFGQTEKEVPAILLYGRDNPMDGAVLQVLLKKAKEIRNALGVSVPVPMDSATVMEAVLKALFFRGETVSGQLPLFVDPVVTEVHTEWDRAKEREKISRTRFAQRAIKPDEVERELKETDDVLGDAYSAERFVQNGLQRLNASMEPANHGKWYLNNLINLPELIRSEATVLDNWHVTFTSPAPEGITYLGRNHPFIAALAQYLLEASITQNGQSPATRCGVVRTSKVQKQTILLMMRLRFQLEEPGHKALLAEEILTAGFQGYPPDQLHWLDEKDVKELLIETRAQESVTPQERLSTLKSKLDMWPDLQDDLSRLVHERALHLQTAHRRVRSAAGLSRRGVNVQEHLPPDLLGLFVLMPIPRGVAPRREGQP